MALTRRDRNRAFAVVAAIAAMAPNLAGAQKPARETAVPVSVEFRGDPADGVRGDGGIYFNGVNNVRSELVGNAWGNFVFDTNDDASIDGNRRLVIDFRGQPTPSDVAPSFAADVFFSTIGVTGDASVDGNVRMMKAADVLPRRTRIAWVTGNLQYSLGWNGPENDGHGFLEFRCDRDDGTACEQWTVTPGGDAGLYSVPTKGKATQTYYGTYVMPFSATLLK
jgi:hypothetical protein